VHAHQPHHLLVAWWDSVGADVESVVPVVAVLPEASLAFLQEQGVVENEVAGQSCELCALGGQVQVVDPLVSVADLEHDAESKGLVNSSVDLGLGVLGNEGSFEDQGVDKLHFSQVVVAVDGVL